MPVEITFPVFSHTQLLLDTSAHTSFYIHTQTILGLLTFGRPVWPSRDAWLVRKYTGVIGQHVPAPGRAEGSGRSESDGYLPGAVVQTGRLRPPPATPRIFMRGVPPSHQPGACETLTHRDTAWSAPRTPGRPTGPSKRIPKRWGRSRVIPDGSWERGPLRSPPAPPHLTIRSR